MPRARPYGRKDKPPPSTDISAFQEALRSARNIVAVTGAGLSAASGIPTFRGAGGFWRNYDAVSLATPEAFAENHSLVWQFYHYRREKALESKPNAGHAALSLFSIPDLRKEVTHPEGITFHHITQNVDGLAIRCLKSVYATHNLPEPSQSTVDADGHPILIEMHGRLHDLQCNSKRCKHVEFNTTSPICPALAGTELILAQPEEANEEKSEVPDAPEIADKDLPRCSKCGGLARPGVVWFGEIPHQLEVIDKIVEKADLCLVIGTSSVVYPAAGYADEISRNGGKVAIFNLEASAGDSDADFLFRGPCEETLIKALGLGQGSAIPA